MANEITVNATLACTNGSFKLPNLGGRKSVNMAAQGLAAKVTSIATSDTQVITTGVTTLGWAYFCNLDATNFVEIGNYTSSTLYPFVRLKPGESCVLRLAQGITIYAKADTGAVNLQHAILND